MSSPHMPLVLVVWDDAWQDQENFASSHGIITSHHPMVVQTLGWLVHEDETGVSVVNERSLDDSGDVYRGRTFIPKPMIRSVNRFNLTRPRKPVPPKEPTP